MLIDNQEIVSKLGEGQQAKSQLVKNKEGKSQAAKIFKRIRAKMRTEEEKNQVAESSSLELSHPNLLAQFGAQDEGMITTSKGTTRLPQILQEQCAKGDLFKFLQDGGAFSEEASKAILFQLLLGLQFLKCNGLSHLDIKPENILLDEDQVPKIADQGFIGEYTERSERFKVGTEGYNSPQITEKIPYNSEKADIFALGSLMCVVLNRNPWFVDTSQKTDRNFNQLIKMGNMKKHLLSCKYSEGCADLMSGLTAQEEADRFDIDQALAHPWLQDAPSQLQQMKSEFAKKDSTIKINFESS